jgi:CubicO group peptidase (beta-lactamase class C family)
MKSEKISEFLQSRIEAKDFPSFIWAVGKGEGIFWGQGGFSVIQPQEIKASISTIYDLASLTKPLITGLLCAKLIERKGLNLNFPLHYYLSEFDKTDKRDITIEHLLVHSSGFPAWKPFYLFAETREEVLKLIASEPLEAKPNERVKYSDFNFITLSFLLEKIYRIRLDKIAQREIFEPLRLFHTFFNRTVKLDVHQTNYHYKEKLYLIAGSEFGNEYEKQMCVDLGYDVSKYKWRDYQIWGEVHDGNCYFMNGVSGHAGLFSTAFETFEIAQQFLANQTTLLKPETCQIFRTNFTKKLNEARSIGFQLAETKDSTASLALSKDSFGHLGFTGTSLWIEPETERIFILLTNRTHARELPFANINSTRRRFHELAVEALNEK